MHSTPSYQGVSFSRKDSISFEVLRLASFAITPSIRVSPRSSKRYRTISNPSVCGPTLELSSISNQPVRLPICISVALKEYPNATEEADNRNVVPEKLAAAEISTL